MISHCSGPHHIGGMQPGMNGEPYVAHVFRVFGSKYLRAEIDGKVFANSEEANKEIINKGYGCEYYPRQSVRTFSFDRDCEKFDAIYRYFKWVKKQKELKNKYKIILKTRQKLEKLAKIVGIFHPCTKLFLNKG